MMRQVFRALPLVAAALAAAPSAVAQEGTLNPEEGGFWHLTEAIATRPDLVGITCWQVYEAQKGGQHEAAAAALLACAEAGNEPSMILLSHAYENGQGFAQSDAKATFWVKQAALRGYAPAQLHYARALMAGTGVPQDAGQARFWLMQAALQGDSDASALLAANPAS